MTYIVFRVKESKGDGLMFDEDVALADAPQETLKRRQQRRQNNTGDEPIKMSHIHSASEEKKHL